MNRFHRVIVRKVAPLLGAGMLLQVGGCDAEVVSSTVAGLATSVVNSLIANFVYGAFGLV